MPLPPLPRVALRVVEDTSPGAEGFLQLHRCRLVVAGSSGESEPFPYDYVDRDALDAVVVAAHYRDAEGRRCVFLRSALRPPAQLRPADRRPLPEKATLGSVWELPAGLVEAGEYSPEGLARCGARELEEELGFRVEASQLRPLGPATFPSAGVIGERHHFFHVEVEPGARGEPTLDGSVLERGAVITSLTLDDALAAIRAGDVEDSKTEIALRRLAEL